MKQNEVKKYVITERQLLDRELAEGMRGFGIGLFVGGWVGFAWQDGPKVPSSSYIMMGIGAVLTIGSLFVGPKEKDFEVITEEAK